MLRKQHWIMREHKNVLIFALLHSDLVTHQNHRLCDTTYNTKYYDKNRIIYIHFVLQVIMHNYPLNTESSK